MSIYRKALGDHGEALASEILERECYRIVQRNFRCRAGEIDIIAEKDGVIHFIEVKTRYGCRTGYPAEAVNKRKQRSIRLAAEYYLMMNGEWRSDLSFDVVSVLLTHDIDCF